MMQFPHVDPIPIPAPVWLMKVLSLLTLALHLFSVQILVGSLLAVIFFSLSAKGKADSANHTASLVLGRRLPIVMTYVINLGIPPLLFAQVLYGRALYTSSILVAAQWISVVFLLMGCYWLLYGISDRSSKGKSTHWQAIGALILASAVGHIYATNMTLMLKPEVWQAMYAKTASGLQAPPADPTTEPRFLFVMVGGLVAGGFWMILHSRLRLLDIEAASKLRRLGIVFTLLGAVTELGMGFWAYSVQPTFVIDGLKSTYYIGSQLLWGVGIVLALVAILLQIPSKKGGILLPIVGTVGAFLGIAGSVMVRDGIRDLTLFQKGFNVWNRQEASNWFVIVLFALLFVIGIGVIGWLLSVMKRAEPLPEKVIL